MSRLKKRLIVTAGEGTSPIEDWEPVSYAVDGMPEGQIAILTEIKEGWIIVRHIDGVEEKSVRTYRTADDALEALEKQVASR
ncbi:MAG: hypothetical protein ACR2JB_23520 [Bryobacteraceae bacterium]